MTLTFGLIISTGTSAQIITIDNDFCVNLSPNDKVLYQKNIVTDEKELYSLANSNTKDNYIAETTLSCNTKKSNNLAEKQVFAVPTKSYLQHYLTVQHPTGEIERYYCLDAFADIPQDSLVISNSTFSKSTITEGEIVTPGNREHDSTYSVRAWAKIHYIEGSITVSTEYNEYIIGRWYRGTVLKDDNAVSVSNRRIWFRNKGYELLTHKYQNETIGPRYAASGSNTVTVTAPERFYTLITFPSFPYELTCTCVADISRGTRTWNVQTTVSKNSY